MNEIIGTGSGQRRGQLPRQAMLLSRASAVALGLIALPLLPGAFGPSYSLTGAQAAEDKSADDISKGQRREQYCQQ